MKRKHFKGIKDTFGYREHKPSTVKAYTITDLGKKRLKRTTTPRLTYEEAVILQALGNKQCTAGELVDVCSFMYTPSVKGAIDNLIELGLIERRDVTI